VDGKNFNLNFDPEESQMKSLTAAWHSLGQAIYEADNKVPFILISVIVGALHYTIAEYFGLTYHHAIHTDGVHFAANHVAIWIFFAGLGAHIKLQEVQEGGFVIGSAIVGGMVIPPLLVWVLTDNFWLSLGAMATDVAFSVGAAKIAKAGNKKVLAAAFTGLIILAVGDDLGGVLAMAGVYSEAVYFVIIIAILLVIMLSWVIGVLEAVIEQAHEANVMVWKRSHQFLFSGWFWIGLAVVSTILLAQAKVEWVLGACLVLIAAPMRIKKVVECTLKPIVPLALLLFGFVSGSLDLLAEESWGWITAATFMGGMLGKIGGIFSFGLVGMQLAKRWQPNSKYLSMSKRDLFAISHFASANGTVAIFFVVTALNKGVVTSVEAQQAILGYFLTVPAMYAIMFILKAVNFYQEEGHLKHTP
jgi:hypothetical protein